MRRDSRKVRHFSDANLASHILYVYSEGSLKDGQCEYKDNNEVLLRNHCCRGQAISITPSEACVCSLSYPVCKARAPYYIFICVLWLHHVSPNYLINGTIFRKKCIKYKMRVLIFCKILKHFSI